MECHRSLSFLFAILLSCLVILSCNNSDGGSSVVTNPQQMDEQAGKSLESALTYALEHKGKVDDSITLQMPVVVKAFYEDNKFEVIWSHKEKWSTLGDSLYHYIETAELQGLFPGDYHLKNLRSLKNKLDTDSLKRMDAALWAKADLMLTDGFMHMIKDLKQGRLQNDSVSLVKDSLIADKFYVKNLQTVLEKKELTTVMQSLEPKHRGYLELKKGIQSFLDSMDRRTYTYVVYPYKDSADSLRFVKVLQKRLNESGCIDMNSKRPDSAALLTAIKKYQRQKGLAADGKVTASFIRNLNISDAERFKRIAITLDRYKQLPEKMPERYIWVNLAGYYLQVWDHDTMALESRTIVGKAVTRTPVLNSMITDMVTYPTWTVPSSIIAKEMLPGLKRNPGYLARRGLKLLNGRGENINPSSINWSKYSKGIPFRIQQGSGDGNALGIFKFNFSNKYSVYLHDTNQRYLFKNAARALSHGCVRVQEWEKLAFYIARTDSVMANPGDSLRYTTDSIKNWIAAKSNRRMEVKNKIALFIRYFSCEGKNGKVKFYDDIYGEDKAMREKYFADNK
jgi:L,D-transpeptidase YcbB